VRAGGYGAVEAAEVSFWPDLLQGRNRPLRCDRRWCSGPVAVAARLSWRGASS